jgi:hypothetical protein
VEHDLIKRLERVAKLGIRILPLAEINSHFVFERDGFVVLVERRDGGFGGVGGPGQLSEKGFSALVDRQGASWFVGKGGERQAGAGEAEAARKLFTDLKSALS